MSRNLSKGNYRLGLDVLAERAEGGRAAAIAVYPVKGD
jgi:hypothetical protein